MNERVKIALDGVLKAFESGSVPDAIAYVVFPSIDIPLKKWSLLNRLIAFLSGSRDVRGIRQWNKIGRYPRKGSHAVYILAPSIKKVTNGETGEDQAILKGFIGVPVFRVEDTDGQPINYPDLELPPFPLMDKAREWGINITPVEGNTEYYGCYRLGHGEIVLASPEESVFFHELAHVAHHRAKGSLKSGQDPAQEIVAELSAAVLCRLVGKQHDRSLGNSYRYIRAYAEKQKINPYTACMKVLGETEKVLSLILNTDGNTS